MDETNEEDIKRKYKSFEYATYEEDKIEILNELVKYSQINPIAVGTFCLAGVFESIFTMDETEPQYFIIENVFRSNMKDAFIEILFDDIKHIELFISLSANEIIYLINIFNTDAFSRVLLDRSRSSVIKMILKLINTNQLDVNNIYIDQIIKVIREDSDIINNVINMKYNSDTCKIILKICDNSVINQQIFVNSDLYINNIIDMNIEILKMVLNPRNKEYGNIQGGLLIKEVIDRLILNNEYEIIYKLIYGNINALRVTDDHIDIKKLISDSDGCFYASNILELFMHVKEVEGDGFIYAILSSINNKEGMCTQEIFIDDKKIHIYLCYLIFCSPVLNNDVIDYITDQFTDKLNNITSYLCLLLSLIHNIDISITVYETLIYLKSFRSYLTNNNIFSNKIDEILLDTTIQFIKCYDQFIFDLNITDYDQIKVEYKKYKQVNKVEMEIKDVDENGGLFNIDNLEKLNQGIQNVLKFFKHNDE